MLMIMTTRMMTMSTKMLIMTTKMLTMRITTSPSMMISPTHLTMVLSMKMMTTMRKKTTNQASQRQTLLV